MHLPLLAVTLALAVHAGPAKPPAGELVPEAPPGANIGFASDYDDPPKGSAAELQLWKDGVEVTRRILEVRRASFNTRARAKGADLGGRLSALKGSAGHERAEHLEHLARRLERAWAADVDVYKRQWPVDPTRGCGYPHLLYDSALRLAPGPSRQAEVSNATPDLQTCVQRARAVTDQMAASTRRLAEVVTEVEQVLSGAGTPPPKAGAAPGHEEHERHEAKERREQGERERK